MDRASIDTVWPDRRFRSSAGGNLEFRSAMTGEDFGGRGAGKLGIEAVDRAGGNAKPYELLVLERGWPLKQYTAFIADAMIAALLGPGSAAEPARGPG
jgi:hypothetical protein